MTITVVQHVLGTMGASSGVTAQSTSFSAAVSSGNAVIGFFIASDSSNNFTNIKDDKGATYTIVDFISSAGTTRVRSFSLFNITNGPITITANIGSTGCGFPQLAIVEISGASSVNAHTGQDQTGVGTGTDAVTSGNVTTTVPCFVWGSTGAPAGAGTTAAGTGYTLLDHDTTGLDWAIADEWKQQSSTGTVATTFTSGSASDTEFLTVLLAIAPVPFIPPRRRVNTYTLSIITQH